MEALPEAIPTRIAFLRERVAAAEASPHRTTFDVPFRQRQLSLVKIDVPLPFPLYNVRSGRTHRAQTEWVERNGAAADFFADPEDDAVQRAQHEILLEMVDERDLASDLELREQRNPIVLTYDGFIIDGNRRVAALRRQGDVENAIAVVLPRDAERHEVYETELELQMARETRAEYDWIDRALHIRYGVQELNESTQSVASRMNVAATEVDAVIARLALVDLYLDWLAAPGAYHRVPDDSEQSFRELADREARQQFRALAELQRRIVRYACFAVIRHEDGGYMDVRRVADSIRAHPSDVVNRTRERLPDDVAERLDTPIESTDQPTAGDLLSQLASAEEPEGVPAGAELLNLVAEPIHAGPIAATLIAVASDLEEEEREVHASLEPLRKLDRALRILQSIRIVEETHRRGDFAARLAEVVAQTDRLGQELADHVPSD